MSREKWATDPAYALDKRMALAIRLSLRGSKAGRSWEALVGYSLEELVRHIEKQFLPGMSWNNMGKWHVDHIVPKSAFTYESADDPEFRAAWALSNLRPLWAPANLSKGAKRLHLV